MPTEIYPLLMSAQFIITAGVLFVWVVFWMIINHKSRDGQSLSQPLRCTKLGWHGRLVCGRCWHCGALIDDSQRPER